MKTNKMTLGKFSNPLRIKKGDLLLVTRIERVPNPSNQRDIYYRFTVMKPKAAKK